MKSELDIRKLLEQRGVNKFGSLVDASTYSIGFELDGVSFKMTMPLPDPDEKRFLKTPTGQPRSQGASKEIYTAEINRKFRAFFAVIKAKIIAVDEGISTMQHEFVGNAVVDGDTIANRYAPQLKQMALAGKLPPLSLGGRS
jgi:hypothetical protein